jgi:hypothetical protein
MSYYPSTPPSIESRMIDVQYEIEKSRADLEFHEQKTRLIQDELVKKIRKLSNLVRQSERTRIMRESVRGNTRGNRNEE